MRLRRRSNARPRLKKLLKVCLPHPGPPSSKCRPVAPAGEGTRMSRGVRDMNLTALNARCSRMAAPPAAALLHMDQVKRVRTLPAAVPDVIFAG